MGGTHGKNWELLFFCHVIDIQHGGQLASSDGQGFAKPQGYVGKGAKGKGQGRDN